MALQCGIVGLPNVGKSTLFNALSSAKAEAANFPFCTIEPNVGVVSVPDKRLQILEGLVNPQRVVPTIIEFVDIAGLVKGASKGEGFGIPIIEAQSCGCPVIVTDFSAIYQTVSTVPEVKQIKYLPNV